MFISIDPGIANCGLSVIDTTDHFKVIETHLVKNTRKFTDEEKQVELEYGARTVKVLCILAKIEEYIATYDIDTIIVEAPFYNALTPIAYSSLLEVIVSIRYLLVLKYKLKFKAIEPLLVKKLFTNKGMASKEAMKQFLKIKQEDGSVDIKSDIETLSEHEIDAVAVGFVHYLITKEPPSH